MKIHLKKCYVGTKSKNMSFENTISKHLESLSYKVIWKTIDYSLTQNHLREVQLNDLYRWLHSEDLFKECIFALGLSQLKSSEQLVIYQNLQKIVNEIREEPYIYIEINSENKHIPSTFKRKIVMNRELVAFISLSECIDVIQEEIHSYHFRTQGNFLAPDIVEYAYHHYDGCIYSFDKYGERQIKRY